jgi:hypothetical protein
MEAFETMMKPMMNKPRRQAWNSKLSQPNVE